MKHKYKVGDKVVYIEWDYEYESYRVGHDEIIELISLDYSKDPLYFTKHSHGEVYEGFFLEKEEALEFITNYINKTEE
tara:strand:- start:3 stop:236 length:234 start_codon:yes stop_codon:yes gene_type:complete